MLGFRISFLLPPPPVMDLSALLLNSCECLARTMSGGTLFQSLISHTMKNSFALASRSSCV